MCKRDGAVTLAKVKLATIASSREDLSKKDVSGVYVIEITVRIYGTDTPHHVPHGFLGVPCIASKRVHGWETVKTVQDVCVHV